MELLGLPRPGASHKGYCSAVFYLFLTRVCKAMAGLRFCCKLMAGFSGRQAQKTVNLFQDETGLRRQEARPGGELFQPNAPMCVNVSLRSSSTHGGVGARPCICLQAAFRGTM